MAAIRQHPPANIARYLWYVLLEIPFLWCGGAAYGDWSWQYAAIYCVFTALILCAIVRIAWDCLRDRRYRLRPIAICFILAAVLTKIAILGVSGRVSGFLAISLAEGFVLAWAGSLTAFAAPYRQRPDLYFPLAVLWLCQSAFAFGWVLNFKGWGEFINWTVPPLLGCLAFGWLVLRLSPKSAPTQHPQRYC